MCCLFVTRVQIIRGSSLYKDENTLGSLSKTVSLNWFLMDLDENTLLFVKSKET